jgi:hypothetical protein
MNSLLFLQFLHKKQKNGGSALVKNICKQTSKQSQIYKNKMDIKGL